MVLLILLACFSPAISLPAEEIWVDPAPVPPLSVVPDPRPPTALVLNEVMSNNASTLMNASMDFADWVEIYNGGMESIDLSHVQLDGGAEVWTGQGTLDPQSRLLIDTLPFALDAMGDDLVLSWEGQPIDRLSTGPMAEDTAWARFPDGGAWALTARPTPWAPNGLYPSESLDPSDAIFDKERVQTFSITLSDNAIQSLEVSPYTQVEGSLGYAGAYFDRVGVSIKGVYGSLRSIHAKVALKVDVNDYDSHHLRGLEHITFNNMVQDPSAIHEAMGYAFLRSLGLPAPRTGWARLFINGEDRGFYLLIEATDEHFLARWYDDPYGPLWEGAYGVDLRSDLLASMQYDSGPVPADFSNLSAIAEILAASPTNAAIAALESRVDLDQLLKLMAFEALALHWDGYSTSNNYRIYEIPNGRLQMIPWGMDQTWVNYYLGPWDGRGLMFRFCIANRDCRSRYDRELIAMADAIDTARLDLQMEALLDLVEPELLTDNYREYGMQTHSDYVQATLDTLLNYPAQVRAAALADLP